MAFEPVDSSQAPDENRHQWLPEFACHEADLSDDPADELTDVTRLTRRVLDERALEPGDQAALAHDYAVRLWRRREHGEEIGNDAFAAATRPPRSREHSGRTNTMSPTSDGLDGTPVGWFVW
ncbi:MAG: hypothetical protein ABWY12_13740 [Burkholderiales bacterium]